MESGRGRRSLWMAVPLVLLPLLWAGGLFLTWRAMGAGSGSPRFMGEIQYLRLLWRDEVLRRALLGAALRLLLLSAGFPAAMGLVSLLRGAKPGVRWACPAGIAVIGLAALGVTGLAVPGGPAGRTLLAQCLAALGGLPLVLGIAALFLTGADSLGRRPVLRYGMAHGGALTVSFLSFFIGDWLALAAPAKAAGAGFQAALSVGGGMRLSLSGLVWRLALALLLGLLWTLLMPASRLSAAAPGSDGEPDGARPARAETESLSV